MLLLYIDKAATWGIQMQLASFKVVIEAIKNAGLSRDDKARVIVFEDIKTEAAGFAPTSHWNPVEIAEVDRNDREKIAAVIAAATQKYMAW